MSDEQRKALQTQAARRPGERGDPVRPARLADPRVRGRHGKGGVGKSSVTVNLAVGMAATGLQGRRRRRGHLRPLDARACSASTGAADPGRGHDHAAGRARREGHLDRHVHPAATPRSVWRGPMLHRALQQFLADVYWGDLDVLLLDLPPGTGDIAISVGPAAAVRRAARRHDAAAGRRRGRRARRRDRRADPAAGRRRHREHVLPALPALRRADRAVRLRRRQRRRPDAVPGRSAPTCRCSAQVPIDVRLREGGDTGRPLVLADPDAPAVEGAARARASASATAPAGSSACPWASRRPVAELRSPVPAPGIGVPSAQSRPTRAATARRKETAPCSSR